MVMIVRRDQMRHAFLAAALILAAAPAKQPAAPAGAADAAAAAAATRARLDELDARRDEPAALREAQRLAEAGVARAPGDYGLLWRAARVFFTESDDKGRPEDQRAALAKRAYDLAERAIAVTPNDVAAQYWAALSIGNYGDTMGAVRALANGIQAKFERPLERATALDVRYDHGNIPVVWAAYYLELPWPERDRDRAARELEQALRINPDNLRARLYQAQIAADEGHPDRAQALLAQIAAAPGDRYDPPEERSVKREAAALAAHLR
jgi:Tetratricopeptide repeat